jgi:hypothetical protein
MAINVCVSYVKNKTMKILRCITAAPCIITLLLISGCDEVFNRCGGDYNFIKHNPHTFELHDYYTRENLLGIFGQYSRDTIKIFNEDGQVFFGGPVDLDGRISFELLTLDDYKVLNQLTVRELYLYLSHEDIDTLRYEFEMRNNNCDRQVYHYTKLTYNDSVYVDEYNTRFRSVTLYKK